MNKTTLEVCKNNHDLLWASSSTLPSIRSNVSAAIIIIGNEILSGRTKDQNVNFIAKHLNELCIDISEVRIIPDNKEQIILAIQSVFNQYNYVFTTGGIGPTHDDITVDSIASALELKLELNKDAVSKLKEYYLDLELCTNDLDLKKINLMHLKTAYLPQDAELIHVNISGVVGFKIKNIFVLAGIPKFMQAAFLNILPTLKNGNILYTKELIWEGNEVKIAEEIKIVQEKYPTVTIGIYPNFENFLHAVVILKSYDPTILNIVYNYLHKLFF